MKIKIDFVTNSSSSAFVVFIPDSYILQQNRIKGASEYEDYLDDEKPSAEDRDNLVKELIKDVKLLKNGDEVVVGPYGYEALILFEILIEDGLVLKHIEVDGEGASTVSPITLDQLKKFTSKVEKL